jgi:hypothetical protein
MPVPLTDDANQIAETLCCYNRRMHWLTTASEKILAHFPGPVVVRPNRGRVIFSTVSLLLAGVLCIVATNGFFWGWFCGVVLGLCSLLGFIALNTDNYLKLDIEGFEYKLYFRSLKQFKWAQVSEFSAYDYGRGARVLRFYDGKQASDISRLLAYDLEDSAELMNRWRVRALASSKMSPVHSSSD